jgi:hypothetical protein
MALEDKQGASAAVAIVAEIGTEDPTGLHWANKELVRPSAST